MAPRRSRKQHPPVDPGRKPAPRGANKPLGPQPRFQIGYLLFAPLGVILLRDLWISSHGVERIPYSEFQQRLADGEVASVTVRGDVIEGAFKEPRDGVARFTTRRVDPELAADLEAHGVAFASEPESLLPTLLSWLLPGALFLGIWMLMLRRMAGKPRRRRRHARDRAQQGEVYVESGTKVSFDDVAGVDEAKTELREVVAWTSW